MPRILVLMLMGLTLSACGGGGGGGDDDGGGGPNPPPPANNGAPTVSTTSFNVNQDTDLAGALAATDPENDAVTFAKTGDPAHGQIVAFQANGAFTYRPTAGYRGADSFTITASDPTHNVAATVNITVAAVNHAPVVKNDIVSTSGTTSLIDVLANDVDSDGDVLTLSIFENPTVGTAAVVSGKVQLTVPSGFKGITRFRYFAQDPGGVGNSATVAVFVDTQAVRLVYSTDDGGDRQNLFVDDLAGRRQVSALTATSTTSLGHSNVSTNGRTVVWEEATGSDNTNDYQAQSIWTIPADLSSDARKLSPTLQAGEKVNVRSPLSADGKYIVYGVTNAGGAETLYLASLLPGGTSTPIPLPAGTLRIESTLQSIIFGPSSQFVYFTATSAVAATEGQATYRIPVSDPTAAVRLSTAPVADRQAAVRLVSADDSRVIEVVAVTANAPVIERVDIASGVAAAPVTLSHALTATDNVVDVKVDPGFTTAAYIIRTDPAGDFNLYFADIAAPVVGQLVGQIPSDSLNPPPTIDAVRATGDSALVHTLRQVSATPVLFNEDLAEVDLTAVGASRPVQSRAQGLNKYTYIDNFSSVAFTSDVGVSIASRNALSTPQALFGLGTAFYEFSDDNQLMAAITLPNASAPLSLFLVNRSGTPALQLTGLSDPGSSTLSVRVVPVN